MNGFFLIDKKEGWTSRDVVTKISHIFHERKVGHSGTLDPFATGLLILAFGNASKAIPYLEELDKTYIAELSLGKKTSTADLTGEVIKEASYEEVTKEKVHQEVVPPIENSVEPDSKVNRTDQKPNTESKTKQESTPSTLTTKDQFHQELWELIHQKESNMRTYKKLYNKYKKSHLKNKEYFYLYLTILENTSGFEEWKANLVKIPDDKLKSINTIDALKQKLEEYK